MKEPTINDSAMNAKQQRYMPRSISIWDGVEWPVQEMSKPAGTSRTDHSACQTPFRVDHASEEVFLSQRWGRWSLCKPQGTFEVKDEPKVHIKFLLRFTYPVIKPCMEYLPWRSQRSMTLVPMESCNIYSPSFYHLSSLPSKPDNGKSQVRCDIRHSCEWISDHHSGRHPSREERPSDEQSGKYSVFHSGDRIRATN